MKNNIVTIRTEQQLKTDIENLYGSFGITVSDAVNMFFHKSLMVGGLPFDLRIENRYVITKDDLDKRVNNLRAGNGESHELIEVDE